MNDSKELQQVQRLLSAEFGLTPREDKVDFINHLALRIDELILHDFQKLVMILYRIDVNEDQLREMLAKYVHDDAGYVIAQLVIERQIQKAESKKKIVRKDENIAEKDRW